MGRQSTTQRLTKETVALIKRYCSQMNCGVIVRHKGQEIGLTQDDIRIVNGKVIIRGFYRYQDLTILKLTVTTMKSDLARVLDFVVSWSSLSDEEKERVQVPFNWMTKSPSFIVPNRT